MLKRETYRFVLRFRISSLTSKKIKLEIEKIKDNWTDIYEANPGITNLHEGSFVQNAYENLKEIRFDDSQ